MINLLGEDSNLSFFTVNLYEKGGSAGIDNLIKIDNKRITKIYRKSFDKQEVIKTASLSKSESEKIEQFLKNKDLLSLRESLNLYRCKEGLKIS